jgi:hypothetical protein
VVAVFVGKVVLVTVFCAVAVLAGRPVFAVALLVRRSVFVVAVFVGGVVFATVFCAVAVLASRPVFTLVFSAMLLTAEAGAFDANQIVR